MPGNERDSDREANPDQAGLRVLFVVPGSPDDPYDMVHAKREVLQIERNGVDARVFYLTRSSPRYLLFEGMRFRRIIKQFQPHVVHVHFGSIFSVWTVLLSSRPVLVTFRGSDLNPCPAIPLWKSFVGRMLSQFSSLFAVVNICVSCELANRLYFERARRRVIVLSSGIDLSFFRLCSKEEARSSLGWSADEKVVLFNAGKMPRVKRLDLAEEAVREMRRNGYEVRLAVLDGTIQSDDVVRMLNASDCLLITSDYEGCACILLEALACNLPVVSVPAGIAPDVLKRDESSRMCSWDPGELASAVISILSSPGRSNGRSIIEASYSSEHVADRLIAAYREASKMTSGALRR